MKISSGLHYYYTKLPTRRSEVKNPTVASAFGYVNDLEISTQLLLHTTGSSPTTKLFLLTSLGSCLKDLSMHIFRTLCYLLVGITSKIRVLVNYSYCDLVFRLGHLAVRMY